MKLELDLNYTETITKKTDYMFNIRSRTPSILDWSFYKSGCISKENYEKGTVKSFESKYSFDDNTITFNKDSENYRPTHYIYFQEIIKEINKATPNDFSTRYENGAGVEIQQMNSQSFGFRDRSADPASGSPNIPGADTITQSVLLNLSVNNVTKENLEVIDYNKDIVQNIAFPYWDNTTELDDICTNHYNEEIQRLASKDDFKFSELAKILIENKLFNVGTIEEGLDISQIEGYGCHGSNDDPDPCDPSSANRSIIANMKIVERLLLKKYIQTQLNQKNASYKIDFTSCKYVFDYEKSTAQYNGVDSSKTLNSYIDLYGMFIVEDKICDRIDWEAIKDESKSSICKIEYLPPSLNTLFNRSNLKALSEAFSGKLRDFGLDEGIIRKHYQSKLNPKKLRQVIQSKKVDDMDEERDLDFRKFQNRKTGIGGTWGLLDTIMNRGNRIKEKKENKKIMEKNYRFWNLNFYLGLIYLMENSVIQKIIKNKKEGILLFNLNKKHKDKWMEMLKIQGRIFPDDKSECFSPDIMRLIDYELLNGDFKIADDLTTDYHELVIELEPFYKNINLNMYNLPNIFLDFKVINETYVKMLKIYLILYEIYTYKKEDEEFDINDIVSLIYSFRKYFNKYNLRNTINIYGDDVLLKPYSYTELSRSVNIIYLFILVFINTNSVPKDIYTVGDEITDQPEAGFTEQGKSAFRALFMNLYNFKPVKDHLMSVDDFKRAKTVRRANQTPLDQAAARIQASWRARGVRRGARRRVAAAAPVGPEDEGAVWMGGGPPPGGGGGDLYGGSRNESRYKKRKKNIKQVGGGGSSDSGVDDDAPLEGGYPAGEQYEENNPRDLERVSIRDGASNREVGRSYRMSISSDARVSKTNFNSTPQSLNLEYLKGGSNSKGLISILLNNGSFPFSSIGDISRLFLKCLEMEDSSEYEISEEEGIGIYTESQGNKETDKDKTITDYKDDFNKLNIDQIKDYMTKYSEKEDYSYNKGTIDDAKELIKEYIDKAEDDFLPLIEGVNFEQIYDKGIIDCGTNNGLNGINELKLIDENILSNKTHKNAFVYEITKLVKANGEYKILLWPYFYTGIRSFTDRNDNRVFIKSDNKIIIDKVKIIEMFRLMNFKDEYYEELELGPKQIKLINNYYFRIGIFDRDELLNLNILDDGVDYRWKISNEEVMLSIYDDIFDEDKSDTKTLKKYVYDDDDDGAKGMNIEKGNIEEYISNKYWTISEKFLESTPDMYSIREYLEGLAKLTIIKRGFYKFELPEILISTNKREDEIKFLNTEIESHIANSNSNGLIDQNIIKSIKRELKYLYGDGGSYNNLRNVKDGNDERVTAAIKKWKEINSDSYFDVNSDGEVIMKSEYNQIYRDYLMAKHIKFYHDNVFTSGDKKSEVSMKIFRKLVNALDLSRPYDKSDPKYDIEIEIYEESRNLIFKQMTNFDEPLIALNRADMFLHGPAGTGKTEICRNVLAYFAHYSLCPLYIEINQSTMASTGFAGGEEDVLKNLSLGFKEVYEPILDEVHEARNKYIDKTGIDTNGSLKINRKVKYPPMFIFIDELPRVLNFGPENHPNPEGLKNIDFFTTTIINDLRSPGKGENGRDLNLILQITSNNFNQVAKIGESAFYQRIVCKISRCI